MYMKTVLLVIVPIVIILFFTFQGDETAYVQEIERFRKEREDFFRNSHASPFLESNKKVKTFDYFAINTDYRVHADIERLTSRNIVSLVNSDGTKTKYLKYAIANFKIKGQTQQLTILKALGFGNNYLLAFGDETSGISTYGGGRYLDIVVGKSDKLALDFNKSYNPYCAYISDYTCPLPPPENLLNVPIEAGEKNYTY